MCLVENQDFIIPVPHNSFAYCLLYDLTHINTTKTTDISFKILPGHHLICKVLYKISWYEKLCKVFVFVSVDMLVLVYQNITLNMIDVTLNLCVHFIAKWVVCVYYDLW